MSLLRIHLFFFCMWEYFQYTLMHSSKSYFSHHEHGNKFLIFMIQTIVKLQFSHNIVCTMIAVMYERNALIPPR